jgi:Rieske Fe-S protein
MNLNKTEEQSEYTRRGFCNRILFTSAGLLIGAAELKAQKQDEQAPALFYPPARIEGAEQVLPGSFLYFSYPRAGDPAVLVRAQDGEYLAYSRKCAHLGCSVEYDKAGRCLMCPCHRGAYDARTGYVVFGPPPGPLDQIVLETRAGGQLWAVGRRTGGDLNAEQPRRQRRDG